MQDLANLKNETIHVNVLAASIFVTEAIIEYKREHSEIKFEFLQNSREDIYDCLLYTSSPFFIALLFAEKSEKTAVLFGGLCAYRQNCICLLYTSEILSDFNALITTIV